MTGSDDRVDAVLGAFLDHLDGTGDEPSLDGLDPAEQARAEALMASLRAGRGIDPYAARPSLDELLAGTPLEGVAVERDLLAEVRRCLGEVTVAGLEVEVGPDHAAAAIGVRSDLVIWAAAQRLRVQVVAGADQWPESGELTAIDPAATAGAIFGAFPETAGVVVVWPDDDLSSVAIDPLDVEHRIRVPAGTEEPPGLTRPVMPLADTVRAYLDDLTPSLDASVEPSLLLAADVDLAHIARSAANRAVDMVVADGRRARIDAKREVWTALGPAEVAAITSLVLDALGGMEPTELTTRITALSTLSEAV